MIRALTLAATGALMFAAATLSPACADVLVVIDKASQRMRVLDDGALAHVFKTSTGMFGTGTPVGSYAVERLHRYWYSRKYDNAPMPHAIFFHGAYAIHGTTVISRLGNPASHGCVRLHPKDAEALFALVRSAGLANTTVVVTGDNPRKPAAYARHRARTPARVRAPRNNANENYRHRRWENRL